MPRKLKAITSREGGDTGQESARRDHRRGRAAAQGKRAQLSPKTAHNAIEPHALLGSSGGFGRVAHAPSPGSPTIIFASAGLGDNSRTRTGWRLGRASGPLRWIPERDEG